MARDQSTHFTKLKVGGRTNRDAQARGVLQVARADLTIVAGNAASRTTTLSLPVGSLITRIAYYVTTALAPNTAAVRVNVGTASDPDAYGQDNAVGAAQRQESGTAAQATASLSTTEANVVVSIGGTPTAGAATVIIEYLAP